MSKARQSESDLNSKCMFDLRSYFTVSFSACKTPPTLFYWWENCGVCGEKSVSGPLSSLKCAVSSKKKICHVSTSLLSFILLHHYHDTITQASQEYCCTVEMTSCNVTLVGICPVKTVNVNMLLKLMQVDVLITSVIASALSHIPSDH